jgi:hypothetical protein
MKRGTILLSLFLVLLSVFSVNALMIPASTINITVDGVQRTLGSGVTFFIGIHTWTAGSSTDPGHNASQIWVSVQEGETTLLNALTSSTFKHKLCPNPTKPLTYAASYCTTPGQVNCRPNPSHLATEVNLSSGKSLQQAINDGDFCGCVPNTDTQTCGVNNQCESPKTVTCLSTGLWPSCTPTYVPQGRACSGGCQDTGANGCSGDQSLSTCDGAGNCRLWEGQGCNNCPLGTDGYGKGTSCVLSPYQGQQYYGSSRSWGAWSYNRATANGPTCQVRVCCGWQIICFTPRCSEGYTWKIRP